MLSSESPCSVSTLYNHHHDWLRGWLQRKVGCSQRAADLAHDTFLRLLGNARLPAQLDEPRAYLTTVAKGLLINWYQRQDLERAYLEALAVLPEAEVPSEEARYLLLETLYEIETLLASLPPLVRRTFLLSQLDGLKYEDIALLLDISLSSVKRYMQQAFRQCLSLIAEGSR